MTGAVRVLKVPHSLQCRLSYFGGGMYTIKDLYAYVGVRWLMYTYVYIPNLTCTLASLPNLGIYYMYMYIR